MHLRLGQAAWYDAQDQTSRHSQCRCRFHAQSDRLQSDPDSQTAGGVGDQIEHEIGSDTGYAAMFGQSDRLQSDPDSQTAGGVARVRSQREKLLPASEYTPRPPKPKTRQKDGKCATFQVLQQTARPLSLADLKAA